MARNKKEQLITIFGGSGFVGRYIVRVLAREGYRVRVAVRRPELALHLQPLGGVGQISFIQANVNDEDSVNFAVRGSHIVINLIGILFQSGRQSFRNVHDKGARTVAEAARKNGVETLLHMSAIGADQKSRSRYARTKGLGEKAVLDEFPGAIILRPSIIFGPEDDFFNRFATMATMAPALPLIGGGKTKFQPVYVGDVAEAVLKSIENSGLRGKVYELGGPETLSFKDIMVKTLKYSGRTRLLTWVPTFVAKRLMAPVMGLLPNPPLTVDQVTLLGYDNIVSAAAIEEKRTFEGLGISELHTVDAIVPSYLERFRPKGQFSGLKH